MRETENTASRSLLEKSLAELIEEYTRRKSPALVAVRFSNRQGRQIAKRWNHECEGGQNAADIAGEPARSSSRRGGTVA